MVIIGRPSEITVLGVGIEHAERTGIEAALTALGHPVRFSDTLREALTMLHHTPVVVMLEASKEPVAGILELWRVLKVPPPLLLLTLPGSTDAALEELSSLEGTDTIERPFQSRLLRSRMALLVALCRARWEIVQRREEETTAPRVSGSSQFTLISSKSDADASLYLLADVGAALTGTGGLRAMLQECCEAVVHRLDAAFARIWTLNEADGVLELQASGGMYTHIDGPHARVPIGAYKIGKIAEERAPHLTNDVLSDDRVSNKAWAREHGMVAFAGYPLRVDGRLVGVIALFARHHLTEVTLQGLAAIADQVAIAIDRARATDALRTSQIRAHEDAETLEILNQIGQKLSSELDLERLVQSVTDAATQLSGAHFGAFFYNVVNQRGESYMLYAISGVPRSAFERFPMPRNTAIFEPTFSGSSTLRLDDVTKDPRFGKNAPYHGMPAGHLPVVSYLAVPVVSNSGQVIGGLFFGHERPGVFTERSEKLVTGLAAQAAVAMDNARLFRQAQELIAKLERTNQELDQFAYVASHDLKAPLRGIANLSTWLEEDLGERLDANGREQMRLLRGRVHRLEALIDGILDYSRAGRMKSRPEEVDVGRLVAEALEMLSPPPSAVVDISPHLPTLIAEKIPLQQVFMNLLGNALKHAGRPDVRLELSAREHGPLWEFMIRDNGPGIAPQFHERIWGIFQTLQSRDKVESTGIGLAVVRKIVETKGGRTWVESEEGSGAAFFFTWPREEKEGV